MTTLTKKDIEHVFESLRKGLVPERGIDALHGDVDKPGASQGGFSNPVRAEAERPGLPRRGRW